MKKNKIQILLTILLFTLGGFGLSSCKKGGGAGKGDAIFMTGADFGNLQYFYASRVATTFGVSASATNKVSQDEEVIFTPRPELVAAFDTAYDGRYVALPEDKYRLSQSTDVIKAGEMRSQGISIIITDTTISSVGPAYMLPITVQKKGAGGYPVLEGSQTLYVAVVKGSAGAVIQLTELGSIISPIQNLNIQPSLKALKTVTLEGRVKIFDMNGFLPTIFGAEENDLVRIQSVDGSSGNFQIGGIGASSKFSASTGVWYHIASVFDETTAKLYINGDLQGFSSHTPGAVVNITGDNWMGFHIGAYNDNGERPILAQFSEVRIWSKALTQSEIQAYACVVDPTTPGLEACWRLNEGQGTFCADATGHGHDAQAIGGIAWVDGVRCPE